MQAIIDQLKRIQNLQKDPEASTNGQVLEALLDVSNSFPEVIAVLEGALHIQRPSVSQPKPQAQEEARDLIADLSSALDNVLLHHGSAMPHGDTVSRFELVRRAEAFLSR
ncbi:MULTISPECIES: hypothetical protein [Achromobacter]|uniref:Uncharacterized protein n=1 Tax=Achromobacter xylosoxidans (strain A8) TaxID=762376 RepID=E3HYH3_ACHXA|nr:hypothetical protein [Achromobacter xylosoxidans]ADP20127.1 hypothetical protein AXYL_06845 [Achromobacter xylosoxidans A8]